MKWEQVTEERYDEMLGVVPPAVYTSHGFLVGEPHDHDAEDRPRFQAYVQIDGKFYGAKEVMTIAEFRASTRDSVLQNVEAPADEPPDYGEANGVRREPALPRSRFTGRSI